MGERPYTLKPPSTRNFSNTLLSPNPPLCYNESMSTRQLTVYEYSVLSPFEGGFLTPDTLSRCRVEVRPDNWAPFLVSGRGSPTPVFVVGSVVYVAGGALQGRVHGNTLDVRTAEGAATLAHEVYHVSQYLGRGWLWMLWAYLSTVWKSMTQTRLWWDHAQSDMEQEAIRFELQVLGYYRKNPGQLPRTL